MTEATNPNSDRRGLWRNEGFARFWIALSVSKAGTSVTLTALPLTAVYVLDATPKQMSMLVMAVLLPDVVVGLFAGAWVDRMRRRPILIGADLVRFALLGSIPLAAFLGQLTFAHLWAVAFTSGILSVFFAISAVAILPKLVHTDQLVDANGKLAMAESVVSLAGTSAGGALVSLLGAPTAIITDAVSYLVSAYSLRHVAKDEEAPGRTDRRSLVIEIAEGVRPLLHNPSLRVLALSDAVTTAAEMAQAAVFMLYLVRALDLTPTLIGIALASGGIGTLAGAAVAAWLSRTLGVARVTIGGRLILTMSWFLLPLSGLTHNALTLLLLAAVLSGLGWAFSGVNHASINQALTPHRLLGRVTAARRCLVFGMSALGAAVGGYLGTSYGLAETLVVAAALSVLSPVLLFLSPVRHLRGLPDST